MHLFSDQGARNSSRARLLSHRSDWATCCFGPKHRNKMLFHSENRITDNNASVYEWGCAQFIAAWTPSSSISISCLSCWPIDLQPTEHWRQGAFVLRVTCPKMICAAIPVHRYELKDMKKAKTVLYLWYFFFHTLNEIHWESSNPLFAAGRGSTLIHKYSDPP